MKYAGSADLPLHYGYVPQWLAERMAKLGLAITEAIITEYGRDEVIRRLSDPFWFQSMGAVMGMDWHSSGVTTSVMGALKKAINPHAKTLGIYICGGKGKSSTQTPTELLRVADTTGLNGNDLVKYSKLSAKVDNTAVQDGFQLYTHNFIVSQEGSWTVIQQGMHVQNKSARRYHWHSANIHSFVEAPHTAICGENQGEILNLTDPAAADARKDILSFTHEHPDKMLAEFRNLLLPMHHEVKTKDVNLKKLGTLLWMAHERKYENFEELLLLNGLGPRTLQSLSLVSEVIHGNPSRFRDPARFAFAHGGKDGHPFPVPLKVYDETISILQTAVAKSKLGNNDKAEALKKLHSITAAAEENFTPTQGIETVIENERNDSWKYGGRTVFGKTKPTSGSQQLSLF